MQTIKAKVKLEYCESFDDLGDVIFKVGEVLDFARISDDWIKEGYTLMTPNFLPPEISEYTFAKETFNKHFKIIDK